MIDDTLKFGCSVECDSDGDWIIWAPAHITIFSAPGEGVLLVARTKEEAVEEAKAYLAGISEQEALA